MGINECVTRLFADDTVIYSSGETIDTAKTRLQPGLNRLINWCNRNRLTTNTRKTKNMLFGSRRFTQLDQLPEIMIHHEKIPFVEHYKYLGITLDNNLNFQKHMTEVCSIVAHKLYALSQIRTFMSRQAALTVFKAKVLPFFDYGDILYMGTNSRFLGKLQLLQNRGLRICLKSNERLSRIELHRLARIPKLEFRRTAHLRNFMFKRKLDVHYIDNTQAPTRQHDAVKVKDVRVNFTAVEKSVYCKGSREWNGLCVADRNIQDFKKFKEKQKKWMMSVIQ